jgi:hypothetical protein
MLWAMKRMAFLACLLAGATLALAAEPALLSVGGVVLDPSGALIPAAELELKGASDASEERTTSDASGAFRFADVRQGRYDLVVRHQGFKTTTLPLSLGRRPPAPLKITLAIADVREEVTVGGEHRLSTNPGENRDAMTMDRQLLDSLPAFDQDYITTLSTFLDPGAIGSDGVSLVVDGAEANRLLVSPSAIQEVKINQNPYSAEYFRPGRGRIEIVTKASSPEYHGTFNFLIRDSSFDARDAFARDKAPEQKRIYEGSLAGPVGVSKTTTFQLSLLRKEDNLQSIVLAVSPNGQVLENVPTPQRSTEFSGRLTRQFGQRHTLWAEYALEDLAATNQGAGGFTLPGAAANSAFHEDDLDVSHQFLASPRVINQFYLHLEWNHGSTSSVSPGAKLVVQDAFTGGGAQSDRRRTEMDVKVFENLSWSFGKHLVKVGLQAAEWSHRTYDDLTNRDGTFFFSTLSDFEASRPYAFTQQQGDGHVALFQQILGGFVQDDVQLKPNLSVALGARYDYQNALHGGGLAPRAFAAYSPSKSVVLRGGVGFFNDRFPPTTISDLIRYDGQHLRSYLLLNPSSPNPSLSGLPTNIAFLDPTIRTPYTIQFNLGAEWQLTKATTLALNYRGSRGVDLFRSRDVNAPSAETDALRPKPSFGQMRQIESAGRLAGDALELSFRGKVGKVFSGLAQYTLSRTDNNTSGVNFFPANNYDPAAEWGRADFDQRHRLNLLGTLNPEGRFKVGVGLYLASGKPYTLTTGRDDNHDGAATDRPAGVPRNSLQGPGYADLDLKCSEDFPLGKIKGDKGTKVTLALEAFNVLNTVNETTFVGNLSSPFFGLPVAAAPARRLQLTARLAF